MKIKRKIIEIDEKLCNGCGQCVPSCAEGAISIIDGKAKVISDKYCDGLGACIGECPERALRIVEREVEEFDEKAVAEHLAIKEKKESPREEGLPCQCPSSWTGSFSSGSECKPDDESEPCHAEQSALTHWPIQIKLIPPHASFLKNSDLLVASDCTSFSCPGFHRDFIKGRVLLIGCPKFDEQELYREKFRDIFSQSDIKSVTVVVMEVPCCHGMPRIVQAGMDEAGKNIPLEVVTISVQGKIISREKMGG